MQKTGPGEADLYLYKLGPDGFRPDSRKIMKPDFHIDAELLKGTDENYRWIGVDWPDSRYIVVTLSGDVSQQAAWAAPIGSRLALPV
jgi:hypothetical protein